ncbi:hypothetical protein HanXRQr2_Chr11g0490781 [Helianthus annuus]|uniref:Uncharacterized protein n=1 Tax=Helianthus annuus TaxID=4232 RepID=A0A9K3HPE0_HELAN|nr:hypothetical protein HanXRQr2_Chr11g0490781 [Helianthus annuus]KAJ0875166.1 hypothetical protein HanPSC8_Chr11g0472931 [Helianthus annuus]
MVLLVAKPVPMLVGIGVVLILLDDIGFGSSTLTFSIVYDTKRDALMNTT